MSKEKQGPQLHHYASNFKIAINAAGEENLAMRLDIALTIPTKTLREMLSAPTGELEEKKHG